jgi:hypothetical protein
MNVPAAAASAAPVVRASFGGVPPFTAATAFHMSLNGIAAAREQVTGGTFNADTVLTIATAAGDAAKGSALLGTKATPDVITRVTNAVKLLVLAGGSIAAASAANDNSRALPALEALTKAAELLAPLGVEEPTPKYDSAPYRTN